MPKVTWGVRSQGRENEPQCRRAPGCWERRAQASHVQAPDLSESQDVDTVFASVSGD